MEGALRGPPVLEVYSDGSAAERVGRPGGWAWALVRYGRVLQTASGAAPSTTSLVMELEAARAALAEVVARGWHRGHVVELISDSSIALEVAAGRFVPKTQAALAQQLRAAAREAGARTRWVRAHRGHSFNELVDALALEAKQAAEGARPGGCPAARARE